MQDLAAIAAIFEHTHTCEERGETHIGWIRGIYPTEQTAREAIATGDQFVMEDGGTVVAAARINQVQVDCYAAAQWDYDAPEPQVMVLHTLVVEPAAKGHGYGTQFVAFYEQYAREHGCRYLRMDTNVINQAARQLYHRLGYHEAGIVPTVFNGIPGVKLVCLEKKLEEQPWRVCYGGNFWAANPCGEPGKELPLNRNLVWGGAEWRVLSLYRCGMGFVLDLAKHVPAEDVRRFTEQWAPHEAVGLTPEQEEQAMQASPFHDDIRAALLVNGDTIHSEGGCGFAWGTADVPDAAEQAALAHYGLDAAECWQLWRFRFPFARRQTIETLSLTLTADPNWLTGAAFAAETGQTVSFSHPATGENHTLTVLALAPEAVEVSGMPGVQEYPTHCLRMDYTVSPELPRSALQLRDAAPGDAPRLKLPEDGCDAVPFGGAACIGIIGGEDGPTDVFVTDGAPPDCLRAYSSLYFELPKQITWRLRLSITPRKPVTVTLRSINNYQ